MWRPRWITIVAGACLVVAGAGVAFAAVLSGSGSAVSGTVQPAVRVTAPPASSTSGPQTLPAPAEVTWSDNGATVTLPVGGSFVLALASASHWSVHVSNPSVLGAGPGPSGTQGSFTAEKPGSTALTAVMQVHCGTTTTRCLFAVPVFHLTVVVTSTATVSPQVLVQGAITQVDATGVMIRITPTRPVCAPNEMCAPLIAAHSLYVELGGVTFTSPAGQVVPRPALAVGEVLIAAGTFTATAPGALPAGGADFQAVTAALAQVG